MVDAGGYFNLLVIDRQAQTAVRVVVVTAQADYSGADFLDTSYSLR